MICRVAITLSHVLPKLRAGVVALLNAELLARGRAPLGFLNPWLYAHPEMFTDITTGETLSM